MHRRAKGFTLVEILIVLAIVAILAALLLSVFLSVRGKARETSCISQLRQVGLAFSMYAQDFNDRPPELYTLVDSGHLKSPALLVCPSDPWGNLAGLQFVAGNSDIPACSLFKHPTSYFYFEGFSCTRPESNRYIWWDRLGEQMGSSAGIAVCKAHGKANNESGDPGMSSFNGRVLRLQRDGAVVVRYVYPEVTYASGTSQRANTRWDVWTLFSDKPRPQI